ncbi:PAS domain S-box protein [Desulfonatronum thiodismutans]|uniref:PAS domain S-box protein n=1 Tax=Desulfonatronum thiodismutans TaxID=159290 RepID=UPI0013784EED|nr:PAS domain S-box protein [Desulfonatronum thiodismutans]
MAQKQRLEESPAQTGFSNAHDILLNAPIGIFTSTPEGRFLSANTALAKMYGYASPTEMIASITDIAAQVYVNPADRDEFKRLLEEQGEMVNHECRLRRRDGTEFWVSRNARAIRDETGAVTHYQGFTSDITERKRAEEDLRFKNALLEGIMESCLSPIFSLDREYRYTSFNKRHAQGMKALYGVDIQIGHSLYEYQTVAEDREISRRNLDRALGGDSFIDEAFSGNQELSRVFIEVTHSPIRDERGRVIGVSIFSRDITDRKRAERALKESEEKHRRFFETMTQGVVYHAADGTIISANPAAERILGLTFDQMQGKTSMDPRWKMIEEDGTAVPGEGHPAMISLRTGETFGPVIRGVFHPDKNAHIWLSITAIPLFQPGEAKPFQAYATFEDITDRKQAEEQYQMLFREMLDGFALHEIICNDSGEPADYRFLAANPAFERATGLKGEDIIGKTVLETLPETEDHWIKTYGHVALTGEPVVFDNFSAALQKHFVVTAFSPKPGQFACIFADVTDRKRAEEALLESEIRFKALHNASFGGITIHDKGVILECNQGLSEITGYGYDELIGMDGLLLIAEQSRDMVMNNILSGYEKPYEAFGVRKSGEEYPVRLEARNIPYKGKMVRVVEFRDITEQKRAEEALRESEARFRNLFEQVPTVAVQGYGMDGKTLFWNKASERFYGFSSDEAIGKNLVDLIIPDEMRTDVVRAIQTMSETGMSIPAAELHLKRKDGSRIQVYSSHAVVRRPNQPPELFCIDIDLTELKQIEQALIQAKEQAEAANKAKSEFLANMSHEIRTPINGIMGMMQLLEVTALDDDQKQYVRLAVGSANRLTRLLSDILDLSRIEAGKMDIHESEFSLEELRDSVFGLFTFDARNKGVTLECAIESSIPARIVGDEARVRQVLFNLVGNALKFTDKGSIRVDVTPLTSDKGDVCKLLFTVADTGIGIPVNKLRNVFNPFFQVEGSYTRSFQGAGLGLSIVKRLVDLMGGNISVVSTVGEGTTVNVILPFKFPVGEDSLKLQEMPKSPEAKQKLRILLAEDEPSNALPIQMLLEKAGHTVALAEDGQQVLDLLAAQDFDVILMDVQMPVMNGVEATKRIRSQESEVSSQKSDVGGRTSGSQVSGLIPQPSHRRTPIIALTAYAMLGDREKFLAAGMDDYLGKPVRMEDLAKVLERVVSNKKT